MTPRFAHWLALAVAASPLTALATEAPQGMTQFNVNCPATRLIPILDRAYHDCNNGFENGSCETFVQTFRDLTPEYDGQRSFDVSADKKYIVPAIWLAGDGAGEDYIRLLSRLASTHNKLFNAKPFIKAKKDARELFGSKEFQGVLDGATAKEYLPLSKATAREIKQEKK